MNLFLKFRETAASVLPIVAIVTLLSLTFAPLGAGLTVRFILSGIFVIIGLTLLLAGVDLGITPIGERSGAALTAKRSLPLLLSVSFVIGLLVTIAEPDVQVLAAQIQGVSPAVNKWTLVILIAVGIGLFMVLGLLRTILSLRLNVLLIACYIVLFILAFCAPVEFQGVAFDAGGATTGPMTVPFIMALGIGVASVRSKGHGRNGGGNQGDESFGLTGIASIGPVAAVCVYGIILSHTPAAAGSAAENAAVGIVDASFNPKLFLDLLPHVTREVCLALLPLILLCAAFQLFLLKMPPAQVRRMLKGLLYSFIGLVIFLIGTNGGFMPAGEKLGLILGGYAAGGSRAYLLLLTFTGMLFGAVVVCAEPAVWVLTEQVEQVSGGVIKRNLMLAALSCGVALSIGLSMLRILYGFSLWWILIPGYALSLLLSLACPPLFVGIAFDSGGVASGPMTSTFILSFTLGVAAASGRQGGAEMAFGVIALVAMTPLIAIQLLGIVFRHKSSRKKGEAVAG